MPHATIWPTSTKQRCFAHDTRAPTRRAGILREEAEGVYLFWG